MIISILLFAALAVTLCLLFFACLRLPKLSYDPEEDLSMFKEFVGKRSRQKRKNKMMQAHIRCRRRKIYSLYGKDELHNRQ